MDALLNKVTFRPDAPFVYSLAKLLPIVELEKYDRVVLTGGVAYYFYVQKLLGWMLGSFLASLGM